MLCLSRKRGEKIVIGNGITLTVMEVRGDRVKLGIEAPRDVEVHRKEVADQIASQGRRPKRARPDQQVAAAPDAGPIESIWGQL